MHYGSTGMGFRLNKGVLGVVPPFPWGQAWATPTKPLGDAVICDKEMFAGMTVT